MLECVVNVSEGRDARTLAALAHAAGPDLLDVHTDPHHHRTVLTLLGEDAPRAVARVAVQQIDLRLHDGAHPRLGAVDVVPFVPLPGSTLEDARHARDDFAAWFADECGVPCFLYGPERSLPDVRRSAFRALRPDVGPADPHPTAGACAVGVREVLVAYNVWISGDVAEAKRIATAVRGPGIRTLGLQVGHRAQVSMNLIEPTAVDPATAFDRVAREAGGAVEGAELVGLLPHAVLQVIPRSRWTELDLAPDRTIEARLAARS